MAEPTVWVTLPVPYALVRTARLPPEALKSMLPRVRLPPVAVKESVPPSNCAAGAV